METTRLRQIQQPSRMERLLDTYVARSDVVPPGSYQIRDPGAVPIALQAALNQAIERGDAWSCWLHGPLTWLLVCEMSLPLSRKRGTPVLQVSIYREDGQLKESGLWMTDPDGKWRRCAD